MALVTAECVFVCGALGTARVRGDWALKGALLWVCVCSRVLQVVYRQQGLRRDVQGLHAHRAWSCFVPHPLQPRAFQVQGSPCRHLGSSWVLIDCQQCVPAAYPGTHIPSPNKPNLCRCSPSMKITSWVCKLEVPSCPFNGETPQLSNVQVFTIREKNQLDVYGTWAVLRTSLATTDDSFAFNKVWVAVEPCSAAAAPQLLPFEAERSGGGGG